MGGAWCGKAVALWLLSMLGVPLGFVRSFVVDNTRATYGEDGARASRRPWVEVLRLRYVATLLMSGAAQIYVPIPPPGGGGARRVLGRQLPPPPPARGQLQGPHAKHYVWIVGHFYSPSK